MAAELSSLQTGFVTTEADVAALDEAIKAQENAIEKEVAEKQALVDAKETVKSLEQEYNETETPTFLHKAKDLQTRFSHQRRIRGDGNCYYRALLYAQCERMIHDKKECQRIYDLSKSWSERLLKLGFPDFTTRDFCDTFLEFLERILSDQVTDQVLFDEFNNSEVSNYYVVFLRLITSGYLKENAPTYEGFCEGDSIADYCAREIEPMFRVADHLSILASIHALDIGLRIEYMDKTEAPSGGWHHDFIPENLANEPPHIVLLYRHDHYDILYPIAPA